MAKLVMQGSTLQQLGARLVAGPIAVAAWLLFGWTSGWSYLGGSNEPGAYGVAPYISVGALAFLAGQRSDRVAAWLTYLGGIVGAIAVAWAAGPVGVVAGADPDMHASYYVSLIVIAAAISALLGLFVVWGAYRLGRHATRQDR